MFAGRADPSSSHSCAHPAHVASPLSCSGAPRSHAGQLRTDVWQQHPQGLSGGTGEAQPHTMKTL